MMRWLTIATQTVAVLALAGCSVAVPGTTRDLGRVDYQAAFATGRETMAQHFSVDTWDVQTGLIRARPHMAEMPPERLLGGSPARRKATLRVWQKDGLVFAHASIAIQREGSSLYRFRTAGNENYNQVPDKTPAYEAAAITPEQKQLWETKGYDHVLERRILDDLYRALHPAAEKRPAGHVAE